MSHTSVLSREVLEGLAIQGDHIVVDCTINGGGHSELIASQLSQAGTLIGIDMDTDALEAARGRLAGSQAAVLLKEGNYRNLDAYLDEEGIAQADRFLFDLGLSSRQLDDSGRGFSFRGNEPLLMTFDPNPKEGTLTAREVVNTWDEENIADIIYGYGDERYARRIARGIVEHRREAAIETTSDLVDIIESSVPKGYKRGRIHPATRTFQALRITVNDEMRSVAEGLEKAKTFLAPDGRIAVITFHSREDRIVKHCFRQWVRDGHGQLYSKKPMIPSEEEVQENPRARSAKLRIYIHGQKEET